MLRINHFRLPNYDKGNNFINEVNDSNGGLRFSVDIVGAASEDIQNPGNTQLGVQHETK